MTLLSVLWIGSFILLMVLRWREVLELTDFQLLVLILGAPVWLILVLVRSTR